MASARSFSSYFFGLAPVCSPAQVSINDRKIPPAPPSIIVQQRNLLERLRRYFFLWATIGCLIWLVMCLRMGSAFSFSVLARLVSGSSNEGIRKELDYTIHFWIE